MFKDISIIFLLLTLIAEIVGTFGGFGSSVFFVPIANFYFDFDKVLGLIAVFHVGSNLSKIALFRKGLDKNLVLKLGVPAIIFVILGGLLSALVNSQYLEIFLGIFLVSISLTFLILKKLVIPTTSFSAIIGGSLSGFAAGLLGTGGAIRGLTMAAFNLEKSVFVATSAVIDFGIDFIRAIVYWFNGYIDSTTWTYLPFLLIIGWLGTWIGKKILSKIEQKNFKILSLVMILLIGIVTLVKVLR